MRPIHNLIKKLPAGLDGAIIISPQNRRYFTGFSSSDGLLLVTHGFAVFFADSRYIEAARREITGCEVVLHTDMKKQLRAYGLKTVAIEAGRMTVRQAANFQELFGADHLVMDGGLDDLIDSLRMIKSDDEAEKIITAQRIAEESFAETLNLIREGMTERELALALNFNMLKRGAEEISFETIAVSGVNSSMPHGRPSDKPIRSGEFITMDFGAVYEGYHSDMTRTVAVDHVSGEMERVYYQVLEAQNAAIECASSGISCRDVDAVARSSINQAGYEKNFGHGLGHGVGIEVHEAPNVSPSNNGLLKEGMVVTVEPGIYLEGEFGVRIEDMLLITEKGNRNLTRTPKELLML